MHVAMFMYIMLAGHPMDVILPGSQLVLFNYHDALLYLFRLENSLKKRHMLLLKRLALLLCPRLNAPQVYLNQPSSSTLVSINGVKVEPFKDLYFRYVCTYVHLCVLTNASRVQ